MKLTSQYANQCQKVLEDKNYSLLDVMLKDLVLKCETLELKLENAQNEIEALKEDVEAAQLTDDQREALELVDEYKTCVMRFKLGVQSEIDRILELELLMSEVGELNV